METHRTITRLTVLLALVVSMLAPLSAQAAGAASEVVNINTADASQLAQLPRVGPALSKRIMEFRKENGNFKKTEDLILVKGIGEKTFKNLEPFVVVEGKTTLTRKLRTADVEAARAARAKKNGPKGE